MYAQAVNQLFRRSASLQRSAQLYQRLDASQAIKSTTSAADFGTILKGSNATKLRQRLDLDPRSKITFDDFKNLAIESGFKDNEVTPLSNALTQSGNIIHLPNSAVPNISNSVFIKPNHVYQSLYYVLDIENKGVGLEKLIQMKKEEINKVKANLAKYEPIKQDIDRRSTNSAHRIIWAGLGYLVLQAGVIGRLTWWDLSWDIMEPVTYFVSFGTVLIGYTYFTLTKTEYTFEALTDTLFKRKQAKLFNKLKFPVGEYNKLLELLDTKEEELKKLEYAASYHLSEHGEFVEQVPKN
ncbi:hypothetical protein DFA_04059 [Cavenderia fasciculata]|uniref:Calcium uniporter protein n=1 Tax=Cavenderia fasciculata TaxID=261658 RepID=F4Q164_CACFS|nr:uncharacterized protein DFA_04059 [Cavenderia fasciculata]EGG18565.1 hypothetical protein DFA_04059 [Cavenderia fasciculata]|eukprot:XP_004366469.1 hypothetical protein DFA_04059 [Cavenderia fasciculata]